jgi:WD40 repeat protein
MEPLRTITVEAEDMLLCCTMLSNRYVCIGSRDSNIYVYTLEGFKVTKLVGHKSGICTLTELKYNDEEYLVSGGDLGCGCVIMWQLNDWKIKKRWVSHNAAVSSIVSLNDGDKFASSSYDKTIKVYSLGTEQVLMNIPNHTNSPVTLLCCNNRGNRLVSASLDNSLNIWRVKRSQGSNQLETVSHETCLNIGDIVCQLSSLMVRSDLIVLTTNNGRALLVDIRTGEVRRTIDVCNSPLVELAVVESQNRPSTIPK